MRHILCLLVLLTGVTEVAAQSEDWMIPHELREELLRQGEYDDIPLNHDSSQMHWYESSCCSKNVDSYDPRCKHTGHSSSRTRAFLLDTVSAPPNMFNVHSSSVQAHEAFWTTSKQDCRPYKKSEYRKVPGGYEVWYLPMTKVFVSDALITPRPSGAPADEFMHFCISAEVPEIGVKAEPICAYPESLLF
jgi:hypothetical protein